MKRLKYLLTVIMVCLIGLGLYLAFKNQNSGYTKTEFILDTTCSLTFYGKDSKEAADAAFDEIRRIESLMSMYRDDSDVSRINLAKAGEKVSVSPDTYKVIKTALKISRESGGAFDITVAPVTQLWNFSAEKPTVPAKESIEKAHASVGFENIVLGEDYCVTKLKSETQIDLGGAAKGYAGDCAARIAEKYNLTGGIIDLGGNIICFGENPKSEDGRWKVGIQVPFKAAGTYEKVIETGQGAIVTSGNYQRFFEKDGKKYHHIIDPKTGYPKDCDYDSVTVVLKSSLEADCLATAAYVMGRENAEKLIDKYNGEIYFEDN